MKRVITVLTLWFGTFLTASPVGGLKYHAPTFDEPHYRIEFPFEVKGDRVLIKDLQLNGAKAGPFLAFKDRKNVALSAPLEEGEYAFVLDYAWAGKKQYRVQLTYQTEKSNQLKTLELAALSPQEGGIPGGREGFYRLYQVEEEAGIARNQEVVTLTLIAPKSDLDPPDVVIFDGTKSVPFEIMEMMDSVPPEAASATHPMTSTLKIVLPTDAGAYEKKMLLVLKGDRGPAPAQALSVSGEGQGVIAVRNDEMVLFRELFDSLVYRDKKGEIINLPLKEKEGAPFGIVHVAPEDLSWVGLLNTRDGFGFFSLRLQAAHGNFEVPGEFLHKAGTYFYAPSDGNYVYWVRPLVYTWADYFTNNHFAYVPRDSFFYEKNAYVVLRLSDDWPQKLDLLVKELHHPLRVF